jgi:dTDP-4-dehydrorhamnose 3,5-epimerase
VRAVHTEIPGLVRFVLERKTDARGSFVKTFHRGEMAKHGVALELAESYHSMSQRNVIRGMHFQLPPHDHDKVVYCTGAAVQDVVIDLRRGSPTFRKHLSFVLRADADLLFIPRGCAHGFLALDDGAALTYLVSSVYAPEHDTGIRWDSAGIAWELAEGEEAILSPRDRAFPTLSSFETPFVWAGE